MCVVMDRRGYVSNQYHGQGGGGGYNHYHQNQPHMPATQPIYYQRPGPVMTQPQRMVPEKPSKRQLFSQDGRDWTTGLCGCFEHCSSCTSSYTHFSVLCLSAESSQHRTVSLAVLSPLVGG